MTVCVMYFGSALANNQNDIDYQKDQKAKTAERIGAGIGGTLASPGLVITVPLAVVIAALMSGRYSTQHGDDRLADLALLPIYLGAAGGRNLSQPFAQKWLAHHYKLPREVIVLSMEYNLTLKIYKDLLYAAHTRNIEKVRHLLVQEMYLFFGVYWQKGFQQMFADFDEVLKIQESKDMPFEQKKKALINSSFFQNYNKAQRKLFGLMMRILLTVYQIYYQKPLPILKQKRVRFDELVHVNQSWIALIQKVLDELVYPAAL